MNKKNIIEFINLDNKTILDISEREREFFVRNRPAPPTAVKLNERDFKECLKLFKRKIKARVNMDDRVEDFECRDIDGVWSFDIEQRLIRARSKTSERVKSYKLSNGKLEAVLN